MERQTERESDGVGECMPPCVNGWQQRARLYYEHQTLHAGTVGLAQDHLH